MLISQGSGQVLWTCMGRNKMLPPSMSLQAMGEIAGVNTSSLGGYLHSSKTRPDGWKGATINSLATCSMWRGMGFVRLYLAHDWPYDENKQPHHTGSATWVNKDCAFHSTLGWRCQVCYWCIIKILWKRRHHHRRLEHMDTKSCGETLGINTWNGQVQMEHPWTLWNEMEELWQNKNSRRTQGFLQLKRG